MEHRQNNLDDCGLEQKPRTHRNEHPGTHGPWIRDMPWQWHCQDAKCTDSSGLQVLHTWTAPGSRLGIAHGECSQTSLHTGAGRPNVRRNVAIGPGVQLLEADIRYHQTCHRRRMMMVVADRLFAKRAGPASGDQLTSVRGPLQTLRAYLRSDSPGGSMRRTAHKNINSRCIVGVRAFQRFHGLLGVDSGSGQLLQDSLRRKFYRGA